MKSSYSRSVQKVILQYTKNQKSCMHNETQQLCENQGMSNMLKLRIDDLLIIF